MRLIRVLTLVMLTVTVAACTSSPRPIGLTTTSTPASTTTVTPTTAPAPAVNLSTTPKGWVPLDFQDAQISVPASWSVYYNTYVPGSYSALCPIAARPGAVSVGILRAGDCRYDKRHGVDVFLGPLVSVPAPSVTIGRNPHATKVVNGIRVVEVAHSAVETTYNIPSLGVSLGLAWPMSQPVLKTLTHSPRFVTLARGPRPVVPSSWKWVTYDPSPWKTAGYAGIQFAVPMGWRVLRTALALGIGRLCEPYGVTLGSLGVLLSTDEQREPVPSCPVGAPVYIPPLPGVQVDSGQFAPKISSEPQLSCFRQAGLRVCPLTNPGFNILVLNVTRFLPAEGAGFQPYRPPFPAVVSIGLEGNGEIARTILDSLRRAA